MAKLTPNQQEYESLLRKLRQQISKAEKRGIIFDDKTLPERPARVTKAAIRRLKDLQIEGIEIDTNTGEVTPYIVKADRRTIKKPLSPEEQFKKRSVAAKKGWKTRRKKDPERWKKKKKRKTKKKPTEPKKPKEPKKPNKPQAQDEDEGPVFEEPEDTPLDLLGLQRIKDVVTEYTDTWAPYWLDLIDKQVELLGANGYVEYINAHWDDLYSALNVFNFYNSIGKPERGFLALYEILASEQLTPEQQMKLFSEADDFLEDWDSIENEMNGEEILL